MRVRQPAAHSDTWKVVPKRVLIGALAIDLFFMLTYVVTQHLPATPTTKPLIFLFDLNGEGNPAAWWQGSQLLLIGLAFLALSLWFMQSDERVAPLRRLFLVTGLTFVYLSSDEIGQIHENTSQILQSWHWLNQAETKLFAMLGKKVHRFHGGSLWIPLFAVIGIALIVWLWPQFKLAWKLWHREILLLAIGFGVLVFAATVIESLGDLIPKKMYTLRVLEVGLEETLESVGSSIALYAVMRVVAQVGARIFPTAQTASDAEPPAIDASAG